MADEACPRCGGTARVETETSSATDGSVTRRLTCERCGARFSVRRTPPHLGAGGRPAGWFRGLLWLPPVLLALWIVLQNPLYSERARLYDAVASALETFRHPLWAAGIVLVAVALIVLGRARRATVYAVTERPCDLHVRDESGGRLAFIVSGGASALDRDFVVERAQGEEASLLARLSDLATRASAFDGERHDADTAGETHRQIYSIGLSLADATLGRDHALRDAIYDLPGEHLLLRLQPSVAHLPWELVVPRQGAEYLWQRFHVGRQVRQASPAPAPRSDPSGPLRVLVLANLESSSEGRGLPAAEREAEELAELAALEPEKMRLVRRTPLSEEELRVVLGEGYDVIHFAGHTTDREGRRGWVLGGGAAADPARALSASGSQPALVFANACGSGMRARLAGWSSEAPVRILGAGAGAYVGTLWELPDRHAAHMSRVFYRSLLSGRTLGQSLTAARGAHMGISPFGWANYVLYGDPSARL